VRLACAGEEELPIGYMRRALADSAYCDQPVFKGSTTVFKTYGLIVQLSEDINLAIADTKS
jgi:hypothetical protein